MQTLYALDITNLPGLDSHWRRRQSLVAHEGSATTPATIAPELPRGGFTSPLGYWFAAAESWTTVPRLRVEFCDLDAVGEPDPKCGGRSRDGSSRCRRVRACLKAPLEAGRGRTKRAPCPLTLEIDHETARIAVDADTWESVGGTVLLAVAQFWRFGAIDRTLDQLSDWARRDLVTTAGFQSVIRRRRARDLRARFQTLQTLILDLPDFEASLTDPRGDLAGGRSVRLYRMLAARLSLHRWRSEIDERIEVVEAIFDSLVESLNHYQSLAFQIVLELFIVAVLLLDAGLFLVDAFAQR